MGYIGCVCLISWWFAVFTWVGCYFPVWVVSIYLAGGFVTGVFFPIGIV